MATIVGLERKGTLEFADKGLLEDTCVESGYSLENASMYLPNKPDICYSIQPLFVLLVPNQLPFCFLWSVLATSYRS